MRVGTHLCIYTYIYIRLVQGASALNAINIYEAGPLLRWRGAHTGAVLFGVLCAQRATHSGGGSRLDGPVTLQKWTDPPLLLSDW